MIVAKILSAELTPSARRRAAAAAGLALVAALMRVGDFTPKEVLAWKGVPDVAHISGREVDVEVGRHIHLDAIDAIAKELEKWDGVTLALTGRLGTVELRVEIDVYAGGYVATEAGITSEEVDVLAEPKGHVGDRVVESFYELFDIEWEMMATVVEEFTAEMCVELETARPLWRFVAVYALRDYSFAPEDAIPLWLRPWLEEIAKYLYRLAPSAATGDVAPELLKLLERHYKVRLYEDAIQLIPLSTRAHRDAVTELRETLEALRKSY